MSTTEQVGVRFEGIDPANALQILPPGANRGVWLAMRRTGIGGSDASGLVGLSRWTSPLEVWEDKTGRTPLDDSSDEDREAAEMGILLEPVVRERFARQQGLEVTPTGMLQSTRWPWMLANPDGMCSDGDGYEGKTCSLWLGHEWGTDSDPLIPDHAELQSQWCMAVTGLDGWWVACLIGGQRNVYRHVARDDGLIGDLVTISRQFWEQHVIADREPPVDGSAAVTRLLTERFPRANAGTEIDLSIEDRDELLILRGKALQAERDAKRDGDAVKNRVRKLLGESERLMSDGKQVATWKHTSRFKAAAFTKAEHALAAEYRTTVSVVDIERLAADHPATYRSFCSRELRFTD